VRPFAYSNPPTLDAALGAIGPAARPLAGGTDLLTLIKADLAAPESLVNVKALLPRGIQAKPEGLEIGALATLAELEEHPVVRDGYSALAQAASLAATAQIRNLATVGGNLLQRPRCWYFRNSRIDCWLKGGDDCPARDGENRNHAILGGGPCYAVHPSDIVPALMAFDAAVRIVGPVGERWVELADFMQAPREQRRTETVLASDELVAGLRLPPHPEPTGSVYLKAMDRKTWAFALAGVACALRFSGRKIAHARIILSGVAPVPWRATAAERELLGREAGEDRFAAAAEAALQEAQPLRHNGYKVPLQKALVRRALEILTERQCS
jgi:xanthine dehydrogenase YagS FAD-binding subunit